MTKITFIGEFRFGSAVSQVTNYLYSSLSTNFKIDKVQFPRNRYSGKGLAILHGYPFQRRGIFGEDLLLYHNPRIAGFQTDAEPLHIGWLPHLDKLDLVYFPSKWCEGVFRNAGYSGESIVVNHGVDRVFTYNKKYIRSGTKKKIILCMINGSSSLYLYRKNIVKFLNVVNRELDCKKYEVIFHCPIDNDVIRKLVSNYNNELITWSKVNLTKTQLAELYRSSDLFVVPSLQEGGGIPKYESLSCGTPVLHTNVGGMMDDEDTWNSACFHIPSVARGERIIVWGNVNGYAASVAEEDISISLINALDNLEILSKEAKLIANDVVYKRSWDVVVEPLVKWLYNRLGGRN